MNILMSLIRALSGALLILLPPSTNALSSSSSTSLVTTNHHLQELTDTFVQHHDHHLDKGGGASRNRNLLQRRHVVDFADDDDTSTFQHFARIVCRANAVPRKELFETWATAIYIQDGFPDCYDRIADLACGHGLLSWALLVLDEEEKQGKQQQQQQQQQQLHHAAAVDEEPPARPRRSVVCIDKRMPISAEKVATVMLEEYPQFATRWDFVEGTLDAITTITPTRSSSSSSSSSLQPTLFCGIHACGLLSDKILSLAMESNAPLVLVPCCHTKKSLLESERLDFYNIALHQQHNTNTKKCCSSKSSKSSLAEYVDEKRMERLVKAGFDVQKHFIPKEFTPPNTVILASPPPTPSTEASRTREHQLLPQRQRRRHHNHPPLLAIPLDDSLESRTMVRAMAGRKAANQRKQLPPPSFCVSLSMPQKDTITTTTLQLKLHKAATNTTTQQQQQNPVKIEYADSEAFFHVNSNQYFRTFRITYHNQNDDDKSTATALEKKDKANDIHARICNEIPILFPGCKIRS